MIRLDENAVVQMARANLTVLRLCRVFKAPVGQIEEILTRHGITPVKQAYTRRQPPRPTPKPPKAEESLTQEDRMYHAPKWRLNPREAAEEALIHSYGLNGQAPRLRITPTEFFLDGKPAGFNQVMRETNRLRVGWGLEQIDANPAWVV